MASEPCTTYSCFISVHPEARGEPHALARTVGLDVQADVAQGALVELLDHPGARALEPGVGECLDGEPENPLHVLLPCVGCDGGSVEGAGIAAISFRKLFVSGLYTCPHGSNTHPGRR